MSYKRIFLICFFASIMLLGLPSAVEHPRISGSQLKTLVIDAGHGGLDPGCNGANEIWEKAVTLAISLKVGKMVEDSLADVKVIYTRKTDQFVELWERANIANKNKADLFLCIHCNSNVNTTAAGSETYFMGLHKTAGNLDVAKRENAAIKYEADYKNNERYGGFDPNSPESHIIMVNFQTAFLQQSLKFSTLIENSTNKISKIKSRGVKQAGFLVLWQTSMPSVLVETGFLTNFADRTVLKSEEGQKIIAKGIFTALKQYKHDLEKAKSNTVKGSGVKASGDSLGSK
jgi:N-acetylmuramoyl-L-alanine amidase